MCAVQMGIKSKDEFISGLKTIVGDALFKRIMREVQTEKIMNMQALARRQQLANAQQPMGSPGAPPLPGLGVRACSTNESHRAGAKNNGFRG